MTADTTLQVEWYRAVSKHEHQGHPPRTYPCDKPWTALCQSDPGCRICWFEDFTTQPEATAALDRHIRENACDPTRDRGDEPPACKQVTS